MKKRGQITIFIIVAVIIIALAVLLFLLVPQIRVNFGFTVDDPSEFIQNCMEDKIKGSIETLSLQGGSIEPENYFLYEGNKIEYLCYTNTYYITWCYYHI